MNIVMEFMEPPAPPSKKQFLQNVVTVHTSAFPQRKDNFITFSLRGLQPSKALRMISLSFVPLKSLISSPDGENVGFKCHEGLCPTPPSNTAPGSRILQVLSAALVPQPEF